MLPEDTLALARIAPDWGAPSRLVETTVTVNDACKADMAARAAAACGGSVRGKMLAVLGLTFKPRRTTCATRRARRLLASCLVLPLALRAPRIAVRPTKLEPRMRGRPYFP